MTMINTAEDIIRLLRKNPEFRETLRRELLTDELLALPQRFAEYAATTDRRLDRVVDGLEDVKDDLEGVKDTLGTVTNTLDNVTNSLGTVTDTLGSVTDTLGDLNGTTVELTLERDRLSRIVAEFSLRNVRVVRVAEQNRASADFNNAIYGAENDGVLDGNEYLRLLRTDMIVRGTSRDGSRVIFVATEASYSVEEDYIEKVSQSAATIKKVFPDDEVCAALYCENISDDLASEANRVDVRVVRRN